MTTETRAYRIGGWTFEIGEDKSKPVSWVYSNVRNADYAFATQITIEKIIVEVERKDGSTEELSLEYKHFASMTEGEEIEITRYNPETKRGGIDLANFAVYQGQGLGLPFKTRKGVLPTRQEKGETIESPLFMFIVFVFGSYGKEPAHEFTGGLSAARFTPAIRFETKNESVKSVRVHCRFHFDLDSYLKDDFFLSRAGESLEDRVWGRENYASLIRDADSFPSSILAFGRLIEAAIDYYAGLQSLLSDLEDYEFEGQCRQETGSLQLAISDTNVRTDRKNTRLDISLWDPREVLQASGAPRKRATAFLIDERVAALNIERYVEFDPLILETLAPDVLQKVVGGQPAPKLKAIPADNNLTYVVAPSPLPGVLGGCLANNIKHSLMWVVIRNYCHNNDAKLYKEIRLLKESIPGDAHAILEQFEPGLGSSLLETIESVLEAIRSFVGGAQDDQGFGFRDVLKGVETLSANLADPLELMGKVLSIVSFEAAEKPVLHEAAGHFVDQGMAGQSPTTGEKANTWDNLHWWGTDTPPSAPGAFHAVHSHFRWTQANAYPDADEGNFQSVLNDYIGTREKLYLGASQFTSLVEEFASQGLSGPLIDPNIPKQTICFAIARNGGALDEELKTSNGTFDKLKLVPEEIASTGKMSNAGDEIVYWLSCKAERTKEGSFKGTLLVNGFYFAHDEERPLSLFGDSSLFALSAGISLQKPARKPPYKLFRGPFDEP